MASSGTAAQRAGDGQPRTGEFDRRGLMLGLGTYALWGIFPIYFKLVGHVAPLQVLFNRVVWSLLFVVLLITVTRRWSAMGPALRNRRVVLLYAVASIFLAVNWYIYIWSVAADHILEGSLGYFINPLMNVIFGVLIFKERMRVGQAVAILVAAAGVGYLTWNLGHLPWIALSLAFTFATYGVLKKKAPLPSDVGMALETAILFVPALIGMATFARMGTSSFGQGDVRTSLLLMLAGPVTAIPLIMFAAAVQRLPLYMMGILQFIAPTLQLLVGVFMFQEPFPPYKMVGFAIIWLALILYTLEGLMQRRRHMAADAAVAARPA